MASDRDRVSQPAAGPRVLEIAAVLACLALCGAAAADYLRWRSARDELSRTLERFGTRLTEDQLLLQVRREPTSHHARLAVARSLIADVLSGGELPAGGVPATLEGRLERLAAARLEARRVLREQPGNSLAYGLLGASIYLERSLTADPALVTRHADWEEPLLQAVAGSAVAVEPRRLLAAAYLECWPALSAAKKAFARDLLRELFARDPVAFNRLAPEWLRAGDSTAAFELIPDVPEAWHYLERVYARSYDWSSLGRVYERRLGALEKHFRKELEEAAERLRLGDPSSSRDICLRVAAAAPRDRRFAPWVDRALEIYPPGLHGQRAGEPLRAWLAWALRLDELGLRPLAPRTVSRLVDAIGDLEPPTAAHAALLAEDDYRVRLAEQALVFDSTAWAPYLVAKARRLAARDAGEAFRWLARASRPARSRISYWLTLAEVARDVGDLRALDEAREALASRRAREWTSFDWRFEGRIARLWLLPAGPAAGLSLELLPDGAAGAVVEVAWDGEVRAIRPLGRKERIELAVPVEPGLHLLEVRSLAGDRVTPATVRLTES